MSCASRSVIGASRNTTSATASASTPPTPSITHGPNCGSREQTGDQLAVALHHRRDEHLDSRRRRDAPPPGARPRRRAPMPRRAGRVARGRARSCARSPSPHSLATTGIADGRRRRRRRRRASVTVFSSRTGIAVTSEQAFRVRFRERWHRAGRVQRTEAARSGGAGATLAGDDSFRLRPHRRLPAGALGPQGERPPAHRGLTAAAAHRRRARSDERRAADGGHDDGDRRGDARRSSSTSGSARRWRSTSRSAGPDWRGSASTRSTSGARRRSPCG